MVLDLPLGRGLKTFRSLPKPAARSVRFPVLILISPLTRAKDLNPEDFCFQKAGGQHPRRSARPGGAGISDGEDQGARNDVLMPALKSIKVARRARPHHSRALRPQSQQSAESQSSSRPGLRVVWPQSGPVLGRRLRRNAPNLRESSRRLGSDTDAGRLVEAARACDGTARAGRS